jgi:hypothetical protein
VADAAERTFRTQSCEDMLPGRKLNGEKESASKEEKRNVRQKGTG